MIETRLQIRTGDLPMLTLWLELRATIDPHTLDVYITGQTTMGHRGLTLDKHSVAEALKFFQALQLGIRCAEPLRKITR